MISSQHAAAEDFDWSQAKRIGSKAELARYIENGRRKGQTNFHVVMINELRVNTREEFENFKLASEKFSNIALVLHIVIHGSRFTDGTSRMTYTITEYPGTRVANAYLSSDKRAAWLKLTAEEKQLYNVAVGIVDGAKKYSSTKDKARYIHDAIHERVTDWKNIHYATAIDALVRGKTDCGGFMDSFYMLGRMAGLNVGRIRGTINAGTTKHAWNWVTLEDGRTYCVDVSQDWIDRKNGADKYKYFVVPSSTMQNNSYWCEWEIIPNLQRN